MTRLRPDAVVAAAVVVVNGALAIYYTWTHYWPLTVLCSTAVAFGLIGMPVDTWIWTRRLLLCRNGSRCAQLVIDDVQSNHPDPDATAVAVLEWTCWRCGTAYEVHALIRGDGTFTEVERTIR